MSNQTNSFMDTETVINRLKRIEGQIRGLIKMVDEGRECEDILVQISSAKSALHKTGQVILEGHLQNCVLSGVHSGDGEEIMRKLSSAIEQFSRMV